MGDRLRRLRLSAGISQGELAQRVDVTQKEISKYEHGHTFPRIDRLETILAALGVTPEGFLGPSDALPYEFSGKVIEVAISLQRLLTTDPAAARQALSVLRVLLKG
jgi:transcriptional regulator with XRE-family HTH domain